MRSHLHDRGIKFSEKLEKKTLNFDIYVVELRSEIFNNITCNRQKFIKYPKHLIVFSCIFYITKDSDNSNHEEEFIFQSFYFLFSLKLFQCHYLFQRHILVLVLRKEF